MKAIVYYSYGSPDVLHLKEVEKPVPKDDEVLIKVRAASVNPLEWHFMRGKPYFMRLMGIGLLKPKSNILGVDIAGQVESVGKNVKQFQPCDEVFGGSNFGGGYADYACVSEDRLALKPANITFEEAAAIPIAAITALQGLRDKGKIQSGQKVLINGAGGGVGTFAVQIAKSFGAEVTGVCSTEKLEMVLSLGADRVIDYTQEDFTENGQRYDLILDNVGNRSIFDLKRALNQKGNCVIIGFSPAIMFQTLFLGLLISMTGRKKIGLMSAKITDKDLAVLKELFEAGKVKCIIDRRYPLSEVAEAIRYLEEGHARGKVIITVEHDSKT
ncbi:NAD(P)-dependent alcohol dehydrogenase [Candidatus Marinimicrobia bacterium MT.SAG.4]|nr:NAD(P)-dependent alcohol dehydrogenase [Candidatus Marinimicrobia bacterium MT.SAG.4]